MKKNISIQIIAALTVLTSASAASALELDWSGQFRAEANFIRNYNMSPTDDFDAARAAAGGYYVPATGSDEANFQTLFLKLRPKLAVNDNIYLKSEWWLGDPVFGFYGNAAPYSVDQRQFYSTQSRGSTISAQRFWADIVTDIGTLQVGRAPLHWGLGIVWNSGDGLWDRYESTGDVIRLVAKFGAFSLTPSFVSYTMGNSVAGAAGLAGTPAVYSAAPGTGGGGVKDYSLMFKYENTDEEFETGVNFIKRLAGTGPDQGFLSPFGAAGSQVGMNYKTWDIFARKRFGRLSLGGELPVVGGNLFNAGNSIEYDTLAFAGEAEFKPNDSWEFSSRFGHAPGQPNAGSATPAKYEAFFFNPAYRLGTVMFNYQFANFMGPNALNNPSISPSTLVSPYDNPIVNANYLGLLGAYKTEKWKFHLGWVYAKAVDTASSGQFFFNQWQRRMVLAAADQSSSLGWEIDTGATFQWDDYLVFKADLGYYMPGDFYKFSNVAASPNDTSAVFASVLRAGISF